MDPITVLLADDHALIRESLSELLQIDGTIKVLATAECGDTGLSLILEHRPQVALLDIEMPGRTCFDIVAAAKGLTQTKFLVTSGFCRDRDIRAAIDVGVAGFFTKCERPARLVQAIKEICAGRKYFSPAVQDRLQTDAFPLFRPVDTKLESLTLREREVLVHLARGQSIKQVAATLSLSPKTVDNYTQRVMNKISVHSRAELVRFAFREQLVSA